MVVPGWAREGQSRGSVAAGGWASQRCAGNSEGGDWLGYGVWEMFRWPTRYDALLLAVELVGSSCHAGLLLLPWPRCEAGEAGAIARTARALPARYRPDAYASRDINAYEQRALCEHFPFFHATTPVDLSILMLNSILVTALV